MADISKITVGGTTYNVKDSASIHAPSSGTTGQYLRKTANGVEWADVQAGSSILKFQNVSVPTSAWVSDATYENYAVRASVALSGVTSEMCPQVYFSMELIETPNVAYAPISETYNGGVYIYASEAPNSAIVIPSIVCM